MKSYVSIDLETTGLNPKTDRIIEIGAVKVVDGVCGERFSALINPGRKLEEKIVDLTGIRDEDLAGAPFLREVLPGFLEFLEDLPLLGHSVLFDFSFLKKAAVDQKLTLEKQAVDTLKIARKYLSGLEHRSLDFLCAYYGIPHRAHRALEDAAATVALYQKLKELFYSEEEALFSPAPLSYRAKRDTPATPAQKEQLYRLCAQHNIESGAVIEEMTRSEASRMADKIFARYGHPAARRP